MHIDLLMVTSVLHRKNKDIKDMLKIKTKIEIEIFSIWNEIKQVMVINLDKYIKGHYYPLYS